LQDRVAVSDLGGGFLHIDMLAHNKSGIAYQETDSQRLVKNYQKGTQKGKGMKA
jgi:hypothetical protein